MMKLKTISLLFTFSITSVIPLFSGDDSTKVSFLDRGSYFEQIILDPTESQISGSLLKLWNKNEENKGIYIPANIGFQQSLMRYHINEKSGLEIAVAGAVFTQFTIKKLEENTYLGEMVNADYKVSFLTNYRYRSLSLRLRFFHKSSHLSDDYILRNGITGPNPGTLNYEQLDLTGSYQFRDFRIYGGLGMVITPNAVRAPFSSQFGFFFRKNEKKVEKVRFICGADIKIFQENNYAPNIRTGLGIEFGNPDKSHLGLLLEYYNGHLPYSVLEYNKVSWLGVSLFLERSRIQ